jgi:uncharacterized membrane protein YkoI
MQTRPQKTKRTIILILIPVAIIIIAAATFMLWPAEITRQQAQEIALAHLNGTHANRAERDFEDFQRVWSVEVLVGNFMHEVYVSMRTGDVVRVESGW